MKTEPATEILARLRDSAEEFCLLLRPFGHDGATVLHRGRATGILSVGATLEEIVALSIERVLNVPTYAVVDQDLKFATPGPIYMHAPNNDWKRHVRELIVGAQFIVLMLPEGQKSSDIRSSFAWELEQITHFGLQSRVILVLPPKRKSDNGQAHRVALHQACVILAAMDGFAGTVDDVDDLHVAHHEKSMPNTTFLIKADRSHPNWTSNRISPMVYYSKTPGVLPGLPNFVQAMQEIVELSRETEI
ncbi:hypothetical protein [Saccharothrix sp. Mg75]|uniref:hypothetical protein n=1 Tax=Saccharothrix sp. Mg75 TaxID=3445357 RepID=UPI003EEDE542